MPTQLPKSGFDVAKIEAVIHRPFADWAHDCHSVCLAILNAGFVPGGRIARGSCRGVFGQHSWIVDGPDVYDRDARIVDPTLWSYRDDVDGIVVAHPDDKYQHRPMGSGIIWQYGRPPYAIEDPVELTPPDGGWSRDAEQFLKILGPLDHAGWRALFRSPVGGWPAGEIIRQAYLTGWAAFIPIDIVGMTTDLNPFELYLEVHDG